MSERELYGFLPILFGVLLALGIVLLGVALILLQQRRTGETFRLRRRAGRRGGTLFIVGALLLVIGAVLALGWLILGLIYRDELNRPVERGADDLYGLDATPAQCTRERLLDVLEIAHCADGREAEKAGHQENEAFGHPHDYALSGSVRHRTD